jgi:hypothetical protein
VRDGRVLHEIVAAEDHGAPEILAEGVTSALRREELLDLFGGQPGHLALCEHGLASVGEGLRVDVGRVDLDPLPELLGTERLGQQHGQAVRLLARRAPCAPHPDRRSGVGQQLGQHPIAELVPGRSVPEEARHVDQHRVEQRRELLGMDLEEVLVLDVTADPDLRHAPLHAANEAGPLVPGEVEAAALPQEVQQRLEGRIGAVADGGHADQPVRRGLRVLVVLVRLGPVRLELVEHLVLGCPLLRKSGCVPLRHRLTPPPSRGAPPRSARRAPAVPAAAGPPPAPPPDAVGTTLR